MSKDDIYIKMENEIIKLSEEKLSRKLAATEIQNIKKEKSLIALEGIIDYIKGTQFEEGELEKYIASF